ncbi:hypothetical protein ACGLHS_31970 [Variovorax sp. VaC1]|uniref:hypothetical protein n=1 Tax=Variovorax sp. VaC1 TaxID=3373132 RepID=UPI00374930AF
MPKPTDAGRSRSALHAKLLDAETRGSQWLADGNVASTSARAERCYDKSQFWLDRANRLRDAIYVLDAKTTGLTAARMEAPGSPAKD